MPPLLSVLMTSYNREKYISDAIESIQKSTFTDWELIIVDDGSRDKTLSIAQSYAEQDPRIHVYQNHQNLGDYKNRNKAASYARGEFIMYVDSDDKILQDGFERCISAMEEYPNAGLGMQFAGSTGDPFLLLPEQSIRRHFFEAPCLMMGPGGTILRRKYFELIGCYPVTYGPANDMYFNLKAASSGPVVMFPFSFNFYRLHEGQELNNKYSYFYNNFNYLRDALVELDLPLSLKEKQWLMNKNRRRFLVNLVSYFIKTGNISKLFKARRMANYGLYDAIRALVHPSL
jgi:glycosyltransferase involved in cell wall biosynthesis